MIALANPDLRTTNFVSILRRWLVLFAVRPPPTCEIASLGESRTLGEGLPAGATLLGRRVGGSTARCARASIGIPKAASKLNRYEAFVALSQSLASELGALDSRDVVTPSALATCRVLKGECACGPYRMMLAPYDGYQVGNGATWPDLAPPQGRAPAKLTEPESWVQLSLSRASPYPVSFRARRLREGVTRTPGLLGRALEAMKGGTVWSHVGALPVWAEDRKALSRAEEEILERLGRPFELGEPHFDELVVAHSGRAEETRERLSRDGVSARCIELLRHNEPYSVSIRFEREAIVWESQLTDRTSPEVFRSLLLELPRLQELLHRD